jgi:cell division protein FtsX
VVGVFNTEKLGLPEELAAVPLETYFPPKAILLYDENGAPVEPKTLRPTTDPYGYFLPPPFLLTTMEAARAIAGDDSISAIRVRVAGVDRFSPEAQSRIEAVAAEIVNRTGLDVDIVVGSSPRPVLVHIPGTGYVEEYWVQKGVSLTTHREVHRANYLLFAAMLSVCALFIFNTTSTTVAGRIQEFGLLKALGWRGSDLTRLVLTEGLLIGALGGALGTVLALGLAKALGLVFPLGRALLILPTGILLCLAGFALPALRTGRVSPMMALRQGEQTWRGRVPRWLGVVGRSLLRRRMRSLLVAGVMGAGAGMLALLVSLLAGMRGYLALTLLGRYILVRVSGYHWGMVGVMMAVGALATADVLLAGVLERRREIGVLKALGWRTGAVARLFLLEGAVLGLLGGLAGTALGLAVYLGLYRSVGIGLLWAVLAGLGVPTLVGVLAAAYPARVAAAVAPAEAVRGE